MKRAWPVWPLLILLATWAPPIATAAGVEAANNNNNNNDAPSGTIVVVASAGSRLAAELKRELEISAFSVSLMAGRPAGADWKEHARAIVSPQLPRIVAVRADERNVSVLSRSSSAGNVQSSLDLELDPEDRLSRRRACLTVVEYLRVLGEADDQRLAHRPSEQSNPATAGPGSTPAPASAPAIAQAQDPAMASAFDANGTRTAGEHELTSPGAPPGSTQPGIMGVGTTFDLSSAPGQPTGHLQFMWYFPLTSRLSLRALVQWPLLGVGFQSAGADVRMWTFGAAIGLQYVFRETTADWRPFLGMAIGNRIALSEASSAQPLQSRTAVTPSANLNLEAGVRYAVSRRVQIFAEIEGSRDWMVPTTNRVSYETDAANALSCHTSLGVLFEY